MSQEGTTWRKIYKLRFVQKFHSFYVREPGQQDVEYYSWNEATCGMAMHELQSKRSAQLFANDAWHYAETRGSRKWTLRAEEPGEKQCGC